MKKARVRVVGAGLAVSEGFAELVCSNSFRSDDLKNAVGLLKEEMRILDSIIIRNGDKNRIPAGSALAVDRVGFSDQVSAEIKSMDNIIIRNEEMTELDDLPTIIATGPLTSDAFSKHLMGLLGQEELYFYDAIAPIVSVDGINFDIAYRKSRYDKGNGDDYINCPMDRDQYEAFHRAVLESEQAPMREFEDIKVFEGCMPVEEMAVRGPKTLLFGPMKPVGLDKPYCTRPHALVQLRQDDAAGSLYNLVGFQTRLKWGDQKKVIQMIPGLENVEIVRYGVMHRNTFIKSPLVLNKHFQAKETPHVFFAGQISGVEGYVESAGSGLVAALNMIQYLEGKELHSLPQETILGSMAHYVAHANPTQFQPMNANFGLVGNRLKDRSEMSGRALKLIKEFNETLS